MWSEEGRTSPAGRLSPKSLSQNPRYSAKGAPLRMSDAGYSSGRRWPAWVSPSGPLGRGEPTSPRRPAARGGDPGGAGRGVHVRTGGGSPRRPLGSSQTPAAAPRGLCRASGATWRGPAPGPGSQ